LGAAVGIAAWRHVANPIDKDEYASQAGYLSETQAEVYAISADSLTILDDEVLKVV
jgi:hypothetical protein